VVLLAPRNQSISSHAPALAPRISDDPITSVALVRSVTNNRLKGKFLEAETWEEKRKRKSSHDGMIDCVVGAVTLVEDSALVAREAIGCVLERVEVAITIESAFSITYTLSYKVAMLETCLFLLKSTHPVTGPY
jgi:hypothetical protein